MDKKWIECREEVRERDEGKCRFLMTLTFKEIKIINNKAPLHLLARVDAAHIFTKGAHEHIKYIPEYIVLLNRYSHTNLDNNLCPLTGNVISKEEVEMWWKRIVGTNYYNLLKELIYKYQEEELLKKVLIEKLLKGDY